MVSPAERAKIYRESNKEQIALRRKGYKPPDREKRAAYEKAYKTERKEKIKAQQKIYREANKEKISQYYREYNMKDNRKDKSRESTECLQMDLKTLKELRAAEKLAANDVLTPDKVVTYLQRGRCYQSAGLAEKFKTDAPTMWAIMNSLEHRELVRTVKGSGAHKLWEKCEPKEVILTTPIDTKMRYFGEYYAF